MMQSELILPPWSLFEGKWATHDHTRLYDPPIDFCVGEPFNFSSAFTSSEESSVMSCIRTILSGDLFDLPNPGDENLIPSSVEDLEGISSAEIDEMLRCLKESDPEEKFSPSLSTEVNGCSPYHSLESSVSSTAFPRVSLALPGGMDIDNQSIIPHLLMAHGEATANGENELAEVIERSVNEKSSPMGEAIERVAFHLCKSEENQGDYLRQESSENFMEGFKVFYQSLPYAMFAHNTAHSVILDAMPHYADTIHVVDFDMGEAIQWPPIIEAISMRKKALKFTSVKLEDGCTTSFSSFEMTKKRLQDQARQCGLQLQVEEKSIEELESESTSTKKRRRGKEWLVFNCMIGLPHMARRRRRSDTMYFLKIAQELLATRGPSSGIVIFGDGEAWNDTQSNPDYTPFFDGLLKHYIAVFESLEKNFPSHLAEARIALESLFLEPYMCPLAWYRDWEEMAGVPDFPAEAWLRGWKFSQESVIEAQQIANERETSYEVKIDVQREHEMVLEWKGTPLVRVSVWTS